MDAVRPHCDRLNTISYFGQVVVIKSFKSAKTKAKRLRSLEKRKLRKLA